ncbi:hypothetical protein ACFSCX_16510 [Bacillus salitolerans]|uniref:Uncharacterized protein n=1 Tax=Bacillus salitolerans TaxID=1437434 RepID=A0ABW4LUL1_9BACI
MSFYLAVTTSDATPRTFVIKVEKGISNQINSVIITQSGVATTIPINEE